MPCPARMANWGPLGRGQREPIGVGRAEVPDVEVPEVGPVEAGEVEAAVPLFPLSQALERSTGAATRAAPRLEPRVEPRVQGRLEVLTVRGK